MNRNEGSQPEGESSFGEKTEIKVTSAEADSSEVKDGTGLTKEDFKDVNEVLDETTPPMPSGILEIYKRDGSPTENSLKPTGTDSRSEARFKIIAQGVKEGAKTGNSAILFHTLKVEEEQSEDNSGSSL